MNLQRVAAASEPAAEMLSPSEEEIARRRETALRRMLATPHLPHDALLALRRRESEGP